MLKKIKKFVIKNFRIILVCISITFLVIIINSLFNNQIHKFDEKIYSFFQPIISNTNTNIFKFITGLGGIFFLLAISIILIMLKKDRITKIFIILNIFCVTALNVIIKEIVARPRPSMINLINETGYSFPSGHAMVNTAFYGFLIYLTYINEKNVKKRILICTFLAILILAICSSRIYLGVHYASDVLAGFCISLTYLCIFTKIYKEIKEKKGKEEI